MMSRFLETTKCTAKCTIHCVHHHFTLQKQLQTTYNKNENAVHSLLEKTGNFNAKNLLAARIFSKNFLLLVETIYADAFHVALPFCSTEIFLREKLLISKIFVFMKIINRVLNIFEHIMAS
jgi:hypothetical protein